MSVKVDQLPATGFSRASEILKYLPFKKTTLWIWSKDGRFVAPIKIGAMTCWKNESVHAWLAAQGKSIQEASNDDGATT